MADDPQDDIEVALKDSTSSVLKEISKEIDLVTRKMVEAGIKGTEAFNSITRHSRGGREEIEKTNVSLSSMGKTMFEMGKAMLGPAGLAAGFVAVSKAMTNFAQQRQQLQMLSTDVGFTAERLKLMAR